MSLVFAVLCLFSQTALSFQEIQEIRIEVKTEDGDKRAAIAKAASQAARQAAETFLGRERYRENERAVQKHIIANHNRYILSAKSGPARIQDDGKFLTAVTLGFSERNLQKLLLEHNLFFASKGSLCILPLVSFAFSERAGAGAAAADSPKKERRKKEPYYFWQDPPLDKTDGAQKKPGLFSKLAAKAGKAALAAGAAAGFDKGKNKNKDKNSGASDKGEKTAQPLAKSAGKAASSAEDARPPLVDEKKAAPASREKSSPFPLEVLAEIFHRQLSLSAVKNGLFSPNPSFSRLREALSFFFEEEASVYKNEAALNRLTDFLDCRLILSGKVRIRRSAQESGAPALSHYISLKAFHAETRRTFFKIKRKILVPAFFAGPASASSASVSTETSAGSGGALVERGAFSFNQIKKAFAAVSEKVLSSAVHQLAEEKQDGALDLHALLLSVQGPLAEFEKERLEKALIKHVPSIKSLQKRLLSSARSVYSAKTDTNARNLKKALKAASVPGYRIKIVASDKRRIELYVKPHPN